MQFRAYVGSIELKLAMQRKENEQAREQTGLSAVEFPQY